MTNSEQESRPVSSDVSELFDSAELAKALETEDFKLFLDHLPIAIIVSKALGGKQGIVFANKAYEELSGQPASALIGRGWGVLNAFRDEDDPHITMAQALCDRDDYLGTFQLGPPQSLLVEAYASTIEKEDAVENYRVVAIIDVTARERAQREEFARQLRDKDMLLKEIQHRVKNNLQLITTLIRFDARNKRKGEVNLDRLAGRIESLQILYRDLVSDPASGEVIDLGHYLSEIASAVMRTYAVEGMRLDLKVDHSPVSINVAMPVGLLVNELLTNSFKHAFVGRDTGTLTVRCLHEAENSYRIVVADDGIGLPEGTTWPREGKLGALILQCLRENAGTELSIETAPGKGTRVIIVLTHKPRLKRPN
ncbi:MAG TPA: histidine kinase dimerization/phosphoacceptor domain -containing protein [Pseudolabrys sp.]|nr:histidine kinase dimerization/phosphoacceptor domain -containing protein [Pseudolabrys sp.]